MKKRPFFPGRQRLLTTRFLRWLKVAMLMIVAGSVGSVLIYRFLPVYITPLMIIRSLEQIADGHKVQLDHSWVPLASISPHLSLAVVCSEDQNFYDHHGFDFVAIRKAFAEVGKGRKLVRGASTISQQTAKNVFLWSGRSWLRKGMEVYFTVLIEIFWSKERILEVYLNSIEMGNGIYGAEAAAYHYYHISARKLSKRQAAAIAAVLPSPRRYKVHPQTPYIQGRISWIIDQMRRSGRQPVTR